jgi:hypothetical protein
MGLFLRGPIKTNSKPYKKPEIIDVKIVNQNGEIIVANNTGFNSLMISYFSNEDQYYEPFHYIQIYCSSNSFSYKNKITKYTLDTFEICGNIVKLNDNIPINPDKITHNHKIIITLSDFGIKKLKNTFKNIKNFNSQID